MRWPFVGEFMGGTQTLTPRVQIVATPPIENLDIPNEDARAFDLEDGNLFAINRFNGYDRFEDGARVTYGFEWNYSRSEEHTSELQSLMRISYAVFCLKKKITQSLLFTRSKVIR